jgi:RNA polymerase sigma-70 factor (ECF subfamily)
MVSDQSLRAMFEDVHRTLGAPTISYETFRARAEALVAGGEDLSVERAGDLYLACACEEGDAAALTYFEQQLMPAARSAIAKVTSREDLIDDIVQELRRRLFVGPAPRIRSYSGRGPLWKWLRITATRTAHDVRRSRGAEAVGGDDMVELILRDDVDPEFRLVRQRYEGIFREALREALQTLTSQERTLLRLRYVENQGIDSLAVPFRAHRATIARWLQNIRGKILATVHSRLEAQIPDLGDGEVQSLWRAVRSQVHFSFSRLVKDDPADG